jgi:hypothetical protein
MRTKKQIMRNDWISNRTDEAVYQMNLFIDQNNIDQIISIVEYKIDDPYKIDEKFVVALYYYEPDKRFTDDYRD